MYETNIPFSCLAFVSFSLPAPVLRVALTAHLGVKKQLSIYLVTVRHDIAISVDLGVNN